MKQGYNFIKFKIQGRAFWGVQDLKYYDILGRHLEDNGSEHWIKVAQTMDDDKELATEIKNVVIKYYEKTKKTN